MQALISGQAGLAFLVQGNEASVFKVDQDDVSASGASNVSLQSCLKTLSQYDDVIEIPDCDVELLKTSLLDHWSKDRGLLYFLIWIESDSDQEEREIVSSWLEHKLKQSANVKGYLENILYSKPLSENRASLEELKVHNCANLYRFTTELYSVQPQIQKVRDIYDSEVGSRELFEVSDKIETFLLRVGFFARAALLDSTSSFEHLRFDTLSALGGAEIPEFRDFAIGMLTRIRRTREDELQTDRKSSWESIEYLKADSFSGRKAQTQRVGSDSHDRFSHASNRIELAKKHLLDDDVPEALKVVDWLIEEQRERGELEHAAKSLCNVAEAAKNSTMYSLQLVWAEKAYELFSEDPRTAWEVGDALSNLGRLQEAAEWFAKAIDAGSAVSGALGLCNIYRQLYDFKSALAQVELALEHEPTHEHALYSKAAILRELGRFGDAIATYQIAQNEYPEHSQPFCGEAAVLVDRGDYEKAIEKYENAIRLFPESGVPRTALGHLHARLGNEQKAVPLLNEGIQLAPRSEIAYNAKASALQIFDRLSEAEEVLSFALTLFPKNVDIWSSSLENTIESRAPEKGHKLIEDCPSEVRQRPEFRLSVARFDVMTGELQRALKNTEEIKKDFPFYIRAQIERSRILRKIGEKFRALEQIKEIEEVNPNLREVTEERLFLGEGKPVLEALLRAELERKPRTYDDWLHSSRIGVAGVLHGDVKSARVVLLESYRRSPFKRVKRRARVPLGVVQCLMGQANAGLKLFRLDDHAPENEINRVVACYRLGKKREGDGIFRRLKKSVPKAFEQTISDLSAIVDVGGSDGNGKLDKIQIETLRVAA